MGHTDFADPRIRLIKQSLTELGMKESDLVFYIDSIYRPLRDQTIGSEVAAALHKVLIPDQMPKKCGTLTPDY